MQNRVALLLREYRGLAIFMLLLLFFRSAIADWNVVPTGSMKPTILEGDRIWVNRLAYDVKLPFSDWSLIRLSEPSRGEIVVFVSERANERLVKRIIGLPGDIVELRDNRLVINARAVTYTFIKSDGGYDYFTEHLPGHAHQVQVRHDGRQGRGSFAPVTIPLDHFLMLGDNRDQSADSRVIGLVPRQELVGRTQKVLVSLDGDRFYLPRTDRFFHGMQ